MDRRWWLSPPQKGPGANDSLRKAARVGHGTSTRALRCSTLDPCPCPDLRTMLHRTAAGRLRCMIKGAVGVQPHRFVRLPRHFADFRGGG